MRDYNMIFLVIGVIFFLFLFLGGYNLFGDVVIVKYLIVIGRGGDYGK